ncbi:DUF2783 domain-containing protein [Yunchengibacter salinarum]|uniref:DUF2783 domain-containing protein n=1 Tax=Yunchengibacter salinarum TaxID=3133399 RepID=UPI0035B58921
MSQLAQTTRPEDPDRVYNLIIDMHRDMSEAESHAANARLILTLANHIGDGDVIAEATALVRRTMGHSVADPVDHIASDALKGEPS